MPSLFQLIAVLIAFSAATHRTVASTGVEYSVDIRPLLQQRCASCHGALQQKAGLRLDTGAAIRQGSKHGPILQSSTPDTSLLLVRVRSTNLDERMPPEGEPLTQNQIRALHDWIASGAPSPEDEKPERDPRDHWAFQSVRRPPVPQVTHPGWDRNPIDAFVAAEHTRLGLTPQPQAPPDVLLRRVHIDLTGLPPTREELRAFLKDTAPDAYERAVDRLLDSPHHGERWARHWMDVWRYADWYGRRNVPDVWNSAPQIWRWRDWIVRSLNSDKGYDRMIIEMIAADEVTPENDDDAVATGFLIRSWYALNPNQWRRDIVEHTGKAFLGLTFNCAHCHDHKYDPISHKEYFQFRAFFEPIGIRQDWVQGEPDPGSFQRYDYSTLRKIVRIGSVRILDEDPTAKTFIYLKGDERLFPPDKPTVDPDVPAFLQFSQLAIQEIALPPQAHHPGTKSWTRDAVLQQANERLATARKTLAEADVRVRKPASETNNPARHLVARLVAETSWLSASNQVVLAQAELTALEARLAADRTRFLDPSPSNAAPLMAWASHAERFLALRKAESQLADARQALTLRESETEIAASRRSTEGLSPKQLQDAQAKDSEALAKARDQIAKLTQAVEAANLALNSNSTVYTSLGPAYPERSTGRRAALARWIADSRNPLTARVAVNHVWSRHFHAPLVSSVFDFGRNGATPTHPALLDWLAAELTDHRWSLKHLHRLIVTSQTYRQSSDIPPHNPDPDNRFYARANPGRMESEIVRDAMLAVAGDLDRTIGGPVLPNTEAETSKRRSLYFEVFPEAGGHDAFSELFDPPDPNECYRRSKTILPQQALALTNSRFSQDRSRSLARLLAAAISMNPTEETLSVASPIPPPTEGRPQFKDPAAVQNRDTTFINAAFEQTLSRSPKPTEQVASQEFLVRQRAEFQNTPLVPAPADATAPGAVTPSNTPPEPTAPDANARAQTSLIHALFSHHDFITIR